MSGFPVSVESGSVVISVLLLLLLVSVLVEEVSLDLSEDMVLDFSLFSEPSVTALLANPSSC